MVILAVLGATLLGWRWALELRFPRGGEHRDCVGANGFEEQLLKPVDFAQRLPMLPPVTTGSGVYGRGPCQRACEGQGCAAAPKTGHA